MGKKDVLFLMCDQFRFDCIAADPRELRSLAREDARLCGELRREAAALEGKNELHGFPFAARPQTRIRQFDASSGVADFVVSARKNRTQPE